MATQATGQKLGGAFYTPPEVARPLLKWAVQSKDGLLLDPSFGEGIFLQEALFRIDALGGRGESQVYGVEIDKRACVSVFSRLGLPNLVCSDFFEISAKSFPRVSAVVGNPPFIRYHHFSGSIREKALACARRAGVNLSELASSWAPFVVHAVGFLSPGGRLAMVLPMELLHASYARPVVTFLFDHFSNLNVALFEERLFPELSQDTLLLFADGFGGKSSDLGVSRFKNIDDLEARFDNVCSAGTRINASEMKAANGRLRGHVLDPSIGQLYKFFCADQRIAPLGEFASIGIGYVTGRNDFFQLSAKESRDLDIAPRFLKKTLASPKGIVGLSFSDDDWEKLRVKGDKTYLLDIPRIPQSKLPDSIRRYIRRGREDDVHTAHKCSVRHPWYSVPHAEPADAFLSYMSGHAPRLCWNSSLVLASNSIHEVRFGRTLVLEPWKLIPTFLCTLTQLSCEIEGHPMGGGMLKLEPSEASRIMVVRPNNVRMDWEMFCDLDRLMRSKSSITATDLADDLVLAQGLHLSWTQIQVLRDGLTKLRESRRKRVARKTEVIH